MQDPRQAVADAIVVMARNNDMTLEELVAAYQGAPLQGPSVRDFIVGKVLPSLSKGSRKSWKPYLMLAVDGYPDLCACTCETCMAHFKGDSSWTPCPCRTAERCNCPAEGFTKAEPAVCSCMETFEGYGDEPFAALDDHKLRVAEQWARQRAIKRSITRATNRAEQGRPIQRFDGRSAAELFRAAMSAAYKSAIRDTSMPTVRENLALEAIAPIKRQPIESRAYTADELDELWQAIWTSGGQDPELDMLIIWSLVELGARAGGPVGLRIGDLDWTRGQVRLIEKFDLITHQPATRALILTLLEHALRRGDIVVTTSAGLERNAVTALDVIEGRAKVRTDAAVLYYRPKTTRHTDAGGHTAETITPRPLTKRRYEHLYNRLKRELPWLDERHGKPHDLRKTGAHFIERAFGTSVAKGFLRHTETSALGTYVVADTEEIRAAHAWWTGTDDVA